jgi:hypothetical protein
MIINMACYTPPQTSQTQTPRVQIIYSTWFLNDYTSTAIRVYSGWLPRTHKSTLIATHNRIGIKLRRETANLNESLSTRNRTEKSLSHYLQRAMDNSEGGENTGTATAIPVASLTPKHSIFESISHSMEHIVGDCEVASQSNRYPHLVILDGDFLACCVPNLGIFHPSASPTASYSVSLRNRLGSKTAHI